MNCPNELHDKIGEYEENCDDSKELYILPRK